LPLRKISTANTTILVNGRGSVKNSAVGLRAMEELTLRKIVGELRLAGVGETSVFSARCSSPAIANGIKMSNDPK
jgi:hypothetical protein